MFVLCYKGRKQDGKEDIYPIYESSLKNIDMYTSYKQCDCKENLFRLLPFDVKNFILNNFEENEYGKLNGDFFIRKSCTNIRKGKTSLEVIYSKCSDIVYSNNKDIYKALYKNKLSNKKTNEQYKLNFFTELYKILVKERKLMNLIDENNERVFLYNPQTSRLLSIAVYESNIRLVSDYINNKYDLKRKVLILFKKYFSNNFKIVLDDELKARQEKRNFSISNAIINMKKNLFNERKSIDKDNNESNVNSFFIHEDDFDYDNNIFYEDKDKDDFLGPDMPNDPKYWSIN